MEQAAQQLCPREATPGCGSSCFLRHLRRRLRIRAPGNLQRQRWPSFDGKNLLPLRGRWKETAHAAATSEHSVRANLVGVGEQDQGSQSPEKVERIEDEVGGSVLVRPGTAQAVDNPGVRLLCARLTRCDRAYRRRPQIPHLRPRSAMGRRRSDELLLMPLGEPPREESIASHLSPPCRTRSAVEEEDSRLDPAESPPSSSSRRAPPGSSEDSPAGLWRGDALRPAHASARAPARLHLGAPHSPPFSVT